MYVNWRERLKQSPGLLDFGQWPIIEHTTIPTMKRQAFLTNRDIVIQALNDVPLADIATAHLLSRSTITQKLNRCLAGDEYESPPLTQALIPYAQIQTGQRRQPLPTFKQPLGSRCAFSALLRNIPSLATQLDEMILAKLKDAKYAQTLNPATFHAEFKRILISVGHPTNQYPYTTQTMAAETVRRYFHRRTKTLEFERQSHKSSFIPRTTPNHLYRALRMTQLDEHTIDLHQGIHLALNDELIPLRLARIQLFVATNVDTDCVLGYHLAYTPSPNQQDLLQLLDNCVRPWEPMTLTTPGLEYDSAACFPSGLPDGFPVSFGTIQLDNALAHLAHSVQDVICDQQAATISMGRGASPTTRRWIEAMFNIINSKVTHRYASTTGSHIKDPIKESRKNAKTHPLVTLRMLDEALSIVLTTHNITPKKHLGNATPLDLYKSHCLYHYIRFVPEALRSQWQPFVATKTVSLKWVRHEKRNPHINFYGQRYIGGKLIEAVTDHKNIIVEFDRRDIRWLKARTLDGGDLGTIAAPKSWLRFRHGIATRQMINRLVERHHYHGNDPLANHFRYLLENKGKEKGALQIVRVYDEYMNGLDGNLVLNHTDRQDHQVDDTTLPQGVSYRWAAKLANHRSQS